jgi:hypothetical protein
MQHKIIQLEPQIEWVKSAKTALFSAEVDKRGSCCRLSKYIFMKTIFFDIVGVHMVPWKLIMDKNERFLMDTKKYLEKKGRRFNRSIQQIISKQPGDPVGPGAIYKSERFFLNVNF